MSEPITTYNIALCIAWCVQRLKPILEGDLKEEVTRRIRLACEEKQWILLELQVQPALVIVRVKVTPHDSADSVAKYLKRRTSSGIRGNFPIVQRLPGLWRSKVFFASTEGEPVPMAQIEAFSQQEKHWKSL